MGMWVRIWVIYAMGAWPTYGYVYTTLNADDWDRGGRAVVSALYWPLYWFGKTSVWFFEAMG